MIGRAHQRNFKASPTLVARIEIVAIIAVLAFVIGLTPSTIYGQAPQRSQSPDSQDSARENSQVEPTSLPEAWAKHLKWRCIGPANMGGRITSFAVYEKDPTIWWAGTAGGGLVKTTNAGITFEHQFDHQKVSSIGDVAVAQSDPNIVWVGTGEANPRNSSSWGNGVYKSLDGGKTWQHMGLEGSFQIGRVVIHPTNPDIVYVGALGRLWGPNEERGLYKTIDGGQTWNRVLYVDDKTGVVEVRMHPSNPDTLLVATYERQRDGFDTNDPAKKIAPGSGLYRTQDGGESWTKITEGLPMSKLGRLGIDYYRKNPNDVFLLVESEKIGKEPENAAWAGLTGENAEAGAKLTRITEDGPAERAGLEENDIVVSVDDLTVHSYDDLTAMISRHQAGDTVKVEVSRDRKSVFVDLGFTKRPTQGRRGRNQRSPFAGSLGGQRQNLQDRQGDDGFEYGGLFKSTDGGTTWTRINSVNPRPMYFSQVRVDPNDENFVYVLGVSLYRSKDGGKSFDADGGRGGVHVDHHAMWIDPHNGRHLLLGNDGGIYETYDRMQHWDHHNQVAIGQFYDVAVDSRRNYSVYGGLQDNGSWGGPSLSKSGRGPTNADWISIGGGDGFVCHVDANDPDLVYFESQNGGMGRRHLKTGDRGRVRPRGGRDTRYRFNWKTPFILSHHNSKIYYTAGNAVFRSLDRGDALRKISPEITRTDRGSATALAESYRDPQLLYVGTDDGALWVTRNGGHDWVAILNDADRMRNDVTTVNTSFRDENDDAAASDKKKGEAEAKNAAAPVNALQSMVPGARWVNCIETSRFASDRAYVVLDGHRSDDNAPYVFVTEDAGETWASIVGDLPADAGTTRVVREDIASPNLLYLGTEFGAWVTIDRGQHWRKFDLPTVPVHDFAIHPTAGEIVAATHGRSLWVCDVTDLRQVSSDVLAEDVHFFKPKDAIIWRSQPRRGSTLRGFVGENPRRDASFTYSLGRDAESVKLKIIGPDGKALRELEGKPEAGLHEISWDLRVTRANPAGPRIRSGSARGRAPDGRAQARRRRGGGAAAADRPGRTRARRAGGNRGFRRARMRRVAPGEYSVVLEVDGQSYPNSIKVDIDPDETIGAWLQLDELEEELSGGGEEEDDGAEAVDH